MPYADPDKSREVKRRSAMKRYWENPSKARADKRKYPAICAVCQVEFLGRTATSRACSRSCSARLAHMEGRANTIAGIGPDNPSWKGGVRIHKDGYRMIWVPVGTPGRPVSGHMMEHRVVMQNHLGRPLEKWEIVHHRNGIKDDNRIENLEVVTRARHAGMVTCPHCMETFPVN